MLPLVTVAIVALAAGASSNGSVSVAAVAAPGEPNTRPIDGFGTTVTPTGAAVTGGVLPGVGSRPTTIVSSRRMPAASMTSVAVPAVPVVIWRSTICWPARTTAPAATATIALLLLVTDTGVST